MHDPRGTAREAKNKAIMQGDTMVDQARNLSAYVMEKSRDIITYGVEKKDEAKSQVKRNAGQAREKATAETGTKEDRPHIAVSAQL